MFYPWKALSRWTPFEIDALGLLTLLGANEVDISVGRLARSYWLEYMPLLAGFVFTGDRFRAKQSAFTLYNISSGIVTGNLTAWFTRWMQAQEFHVSRSLVYWEIKEAPPAQWSYVLVPALISATLTGFLLVMTLLSGDWYGYANTIAIILLIVVRSYTIHENRNAINRAVATAKPLPTTFTGALGEWDERIRKDPKALRPQQGSRQWRPEVVKILVVMPDSRAVTMFIPEHLLRGVFVTETPVRSPGVYRLAQWTGWVAFTVHVVTLGMAQLATQLYVVTVTVIPTVLICYGFGCDDSRLYKGWCWLWGEYAGPYIYDAGPQLRATVFEWPEDVEFTKDCKGVWRRRDPLPISADKRTTARQDLYAWLNLSDEEQRSLWDWHLLPHTRGHDKSWWNTFNEKKRLIRERPPDIYALKARIQGDLEAARSRRGRLDGGSKILRDIEKI
ncbi:uncharacterized protein GIQ15_03656 [Arthroderma uncinatum]|uniref:uncharacterized protein n=1 Tax=Arthroderma uncinatum TaxID=74035 RepID=UPI00144AF6C5|nr:uncharacterized protein GIQ15_03656 [Arthroderma uncinatum]KAF3484332.1 hypothetical protein GIQ15_03656 [Arthroderma uncinatum]